jgi:hypothetical protein
MRYVWIARFLPLALALVALYGHVKPAGFSSGAF